MAAVTPPAVPGTVHCAVCTTGYEPIQGQAAVLAGLGPVRGWKAVVAAYALEAEWQRLANGMLLCTTHANQPEASAN